MKKLFFIILTGLFFTAGCTEFKGIPPEKSKPKVKAETGTVEETSTVTEAVSEAEEDSGGVVTKEPAGPMRLECSTFKQGEKIPAKYTADGKNVSPPLRVIDAPVGTVSLAVIMDDPDAPSGTWVHWVAWNLMGDTTQFPDGEEPSGFSGLNSWGNGEYGGPAPPSGTHRYFFKCYALDTMLDIAGGSTKEELESAMEGHILDKAELMGVYSK
ncbi:YbhB/YbcL family Raf kinase inhibitor-like protein [Elusimicrobiota bacterium]